jgi:hypothetical protein
MRTGISPVAGHSRRAVLEVERKAILPIMDTSNFKFKQLLPGELSPAFRTMAPTGSA